MIDNPKELNVCTNKSAFDYNLTLKPDGSVVITDDCGKQIEDIGTREQPPIKQIINTRTVTILEATGSRWIYVNPPGVWYRIG